MTWTLPVPNGTTWTDEVAGSWQSYGADITVHNPPDWAGVRFTIELETSTADVYEDVTADYVGASWSGSSRERFGEVFQPGAATLTMRNATTGTGARWEYIPDTFYTKVALGRKVRITAYHGDTAHVMWNGTIRSVNAELPAVRSEVLLSTIVCQTAFGFAGRANRPAVTPVGANEDVDVRIGRILDSIGWPAGLRDIDVDTADGCLATDLAGNALDELTTAALTFGGELFEDPATGNVVFVNKANKVAAASGVAHFHLGSDANLAAFGVPAGGYWENATTRVDMDEVVNYAAIANDGGAVQVAEYAASQTAYGFASASRSDLISNSTNQSLALARRLVSKRAVPRNQVRRATLSDGNAAFVHAILTAQILNRVTIVQPQLPGFTGFLSQIQGISHTITPARPDDHPSGRSDVWVATLRCDDREFNSGVTVDP